MSYQPLTKDQYEKARQQFSHTQIMEMEEKRKSEVSSTPEKKGPNIAQQIGQSAVGSLLVRPAARATEAVGRTGILGENIKRGFEEKAETGQSFNMPLLGEYEVKPVKAGTAAARQIIGESLEAGSWLYAPPKAVGAIGVGMKQGLLQSAKHLGLHGAIAGGMFGAGEGLQGEGGAMDVAGSTAIGAGAGALGGAVLGSALPIAPIVARKMGASLQGAKDMVSGIAETGVKAAKSAGGMVKSGAEGVGNVPLRMGDRAIEATQKAAQRQATMKAAPPHIREAMKQGVPDDWVKLSTHGDMGDKVVRADMLELAKASTDVTYAGPRPVSKVGEQINNGPVRHLIDIKDQGVKQTKDLLNTLPTDKQNVSHVYKQFVDDMALAGVQVKDGKIVPQPGSRIPQSDVNFYQQVLDDLAPGQLTYQDMHHIRQKFFDVAKQDQMFSKGTTSYAQRLRSFFTKELDDAVGGGRYLESQTQTREAMEALGEYARLMGHKKGVETLTTKDLKAGESFLRVFGNASDRPAGVLDDLYKVSQKYGYEGTEDIIVQLRFADMLEDVYGGQTRSLGGQVGRAVSPTADPTQTVASGVREMVKWSPYSGAIRLMRASGLLGKRPEDVMRSFENMVLTEAGRPMEVQAVSPIREAFSKVKENIKKGSEDAFDNYTEPPVQ